MLDRKIAPRDVRFYFSGGGEPASHPFFYMLTSFYFYHFFSRQCLARLVFLASPSLLDTKGGLSWKDRGGI